MKTSWSSIVMGIVKEMFEVLGQLGPAVIYFLGGVDTGKIE